MAVSFALTLFLGSALVFLVQPLYGKLFLPFLGGTPAAWNGCIVFFQAGLLAGYAYSHFAPTRLGVRVHAGVHALLLLVPLAILLSSSGGTWSLIGSPADPPETENPVFWLWQTLVIGAGLSFVLISAGAPLLQRWFAETRHAGARNPYAFYVVSNLGSLMALLAYPVLIEPHLTLTQQGQWWTAGYVLLTALTIASAVLFWRSPAHCAVADVPGVLSATAASPPPTATTRLRWIALALIPSSLMLSVTTYLTTDIAAVPLLWLAPLTLYLLTFIVAFAHKPVVPVGAVTPWVPLVVLVLVLVLIIKPVEPLLLVMGLHLAGFSWIALACHGELVRSRPHPSRLTDFYLCLAVGGVLGGLFNALVAPLVFSTVAEYPIALIAACLMMPHRETVAPASRKEPIVIRLLTDTNVLWLLTFGLGTMMLAGLTLLIRIDAGPLRTGLAYGPALLACYLIKGRPRRFGMGLAGILLGASWLPGVYGATEYRARSFFGSHRVTIDKGYRLLVHGNIVHGQQSLDPKRQEEPLTYYSRKGPIGQLFKSLQGDRRLQRVAMIGLGTGALACYAEPGQIWTFFEIDPAVIHIASADAGFFTYLKNAKGAIHVVSGDGRIRLAEQKQKFGLLVVDAFSSDAIPVHLLTKEALAVYRSRLQPDGVIAFHISNRFLDLEPVLANLAHDCEPPWTCLIQRDLAVGGMDREHGYWPSVWVLLARRPDDLVNLSRHAWQPAQPDPRLRLWTDDFSNLMAVLRISTAER
ncbi:MAG: hypothetical protein FJ271_09385 [Planctomycetes bacterium]|nr:hypothetical protein [Planctomycetota bacterium]